MTERCAKCLPITSECFLGNLNIKHHTITGLKESALQGCDLCVLLWGYILCDATGDPSFTSGSDEPLTIRRMGKGVFLFSHIKSLENNKIRYSTGEDPAYNVGNIKRICVSLSVKF
jgi:hypothetical protein